MAYLIDSDIMVDFTLGAAGAVDYLESLGRDCGSLASRHLN
jgi:hypothetical protein